MHVLGSFQWESFDRRLYIVQIFRVVVVVFGIRILELFYFEKLRLLGISYTLVFSLKIW